MQEQWCTNKLYYWQNMGRKIRKGVHRKQKTRKQNSVSKTYFWQKNLQKIKNTFFNNNIKIKIKTTTTTAKCEPKYPPMLAGNNLEL